MAINSQNFSKNQFIAPATSAAAVTPNDSADLANYSRGLFVAVDGNVKVDMANNGTVTLVGLAAGIIHPLSVKRVYATGTTATGIIAVW